MEDFFYVSDIHLEYWLNASMKKRIIPQTGILETSKQYLILAGDICRVDSDKYLRQLREFFLVIRPYFEEIVYVPGNHEYYGVSISQGDAILQEICDDFGIHLLNGKSVVIQDILIIGATLWSYISPGEKNLKYQINDFRLIKDNSLEEHTARFEKEMEYIVSEIASTQSRVIIVTHHCPDYDLAFLKGSDLTPAFGTSSEKTLERIAPYKDRVLGWIYGHTHLNRDKEILGINVLTNQKTRV